MEFQKMEKNPKDMTQEELQQALAVAAEDTAAMELDNLINLAQQTRANPLQRC